ncbi:MAG: hypothetical protein ACKVOK_05550 [Flavobacteriales bacterium]
MKRLALALSIFISTCAAVAQNGTEPVKSKPKFTVRSTQAVFLGKTLPVRDLIAKPNLSPEKMEKYKKDRKKPANFPNRHGSNSIYPEKEFQGPDPVRQMGGGSVQVEPIVNIDGIGDFGSPHDPTGEVGLDHFVQAVNVTDVGVFTKEGVLVDQFAMQTLWQGLGVNSAGDPIVLYDETAQRWFITEFAFPADILVAVSETSDPLGSYYAYNFSTPEFPDYPKYSIWPDAYMLTTNEGGAGTHTQYFLDRNAMLNGDSNVTMQQVEVDGTFGSEQGFIVSTPVDWDGMTLPVTDPMVLCLDDSSWGNSPEDNIRLITFDVDFNNANNTTVDEISLVTTPYDGYPCSDTGFGFQCVPQLGGDGLDAIPEVVMNVPKYRNFGSHESVVCCFVTDATNGQNLAGIRWMEMRRPSGGEWEVYQEGTYSPDGNDRYMGSIAIDENGNIGLGYSISSPDMYVGLRYTGRRASDPLGLMTIAEYAVVEGEGTINSNGRYGDYAQMSVDPVNGNTFWFTSEYARDGGSGVGTRIVAFEIASDTFDLALSTIVEPVSAVDLSSTELLTVEVRNVGLFPMNGYTIGFDLNGVFQESILIPGTIDPDELISHQFTVPMDLSANGSYEITAYVSHPDDTAPANDTLSSTVTNLYSLDASVQFSIPSTACGNDIVVPFTITNLGGNTLTSGSILVNVDGTLYQTIPWTGSIPFEGEGTVNLVINDLPEGLLAIEIEFANPNGGVDELPGDNSSTATITILAAGGGITVVITTDGYPYETTWELMNDNNQVIASGGPYEIGDTEYSVEVCAAANACYTFTIYDDYGDGICCFWGEGSYQVLDPDGVVMVSGGEFGVSESSDFCLDECTMTAEFDVTADGGNGTGTILVTPSNGVNGYQYSIDGGNTYQSSGLFENLDAGVYNVLVLSGDGICTYSENVTIQLVDVTEIEQSVEVIVKPNPTDGFFQVEVNGVPSGVQTMNYQVLDASGKLVYERMMNRYDNSFLARVSLLSYADGVYYIRFLNEHVNELARVVKKS